MAALSSEVRALLDEPNFAHLATLMPDGSPQPAGKESPTRYAALPFAHTPPGR